MASPLMRKQFAEIRGALLRSKKKGGKPVSKGGAIALFILFAFIYICLAAAFVGMGELFAPVMLKPSREWLYFAIFGMVSLCLGVFGSTFSTYSMLYQAKDNELLLSLPIPPSKILFSRMASVYVLSFIYGSVAFLPGSIVYWVHKAEYTKTALSLGNVLYPVLNLFIIAFLVTVLSSILGFFVALIARKLKHKVFAIVFFTILLVAAYYFFYFRVNDVLNSIVANVEIINEDLSGILPVYALGAGSAGNTLWFLAFLLMVAILFGLMYFILSKSFIRIVTTKAGEKKYKEKAGAGKKRAVKHTLCRRELKHFISSPAYLLNMGIGLLIAIGVGILALVKADALKGLFAAAEAITSGIASGEKIPDAEAVSHIIGAVKALLTVASFGAIAFIISMDAIPAPSISLEGRSFWILQTLPVSATDILKSKVYPGLLLNGVAGGAGTIMVGIAMALPFYTIFLAVLAMESFVFFISVFALKAGLKRPMFDWVNETVPVKSSTSVLFTLLIGWLCALLSLASAFLLGFFVPAEVTLVLLAVVFGVLGFLVTKQIYKKYVLQNLFLKQQD